MAWQQNIRLYGRVSRSIDYCWVKKAAGNREILRRWILDEDFQKTDIHYNSLNGEGNFNWRFVFRIMYSKGENVMIVRRRMSIFARHETEEKLPCKLRLQVWDSDHFSSDDFLGNRNEQLLYVYIVEKGT